MPIFNVGSTVVVNVEADTAEEAQRLLDASLDSLGFQVVNDVPSGVYEADDDTEADALPHQRLEPKQPVRAFPY